MSIKITKSNEVKILPALLHAVTFPRMDFKKPRPFRNDHAGVPADRAVNVPKAAVPKVRAGISKRRRRFLRFAASDH